MPTDWLPFVLQTSDPLFPTGSYAHSFGLEEFTRLSGARSELDLHNFLTLQILPSLTYQELPYLRFAHAASAADDLPTLISLDHEINAWKIPAELRSASLRLGSRRLDILLKTAPTTLLADLSQQIVSGKTPGHHITISAAQYSAIPLDPALTTYLYQTLSSYCVAALKLLRMGQEAAQRVLTSCLAKAPALLESSLLVAREEAGTFNPLLEISSMRHHFAQERLFIS
jgi:urease accessory protein